MNQKQAQPFVKWAGGKTKLLMQLDQFFPEKYNRYFEPFLGGGAVFFHLRPENAFLSDANYELINAYKVIKEHLDELLHELARLQSKTLTGSLYERYRRMKPSSLDPVHCAVRFIFLNKTCYNGLYRVNKKGEFNVPFGKYKRMPALYEEKNMRSIKESLEQAQIDLADYEITLEQASEGDLVYLDPPYLPDPQTNGFTSYTKESFSVADEEKLLKAFVELDQRGCLLMLSNSMASSVKSLFSPYKATTFELTADRMINCVGSKRTGFTELLILNYTPPLQTLTKWVAK